MKFKKTKHGYMIRLFKGEKIIESLTSFYKQKKITSGVFHGIGAVLSAEIGFYDLMKKKYTYKNFDRMMEIVGLTGNVALLKDDYFLHTHVVLSDNKMTTVGGHLKEAVVGATCEIVFIDFETKMEREYDEDIGLNLWKL